MKKTTKAQQVAANKRGYKRTLRLKSSRKKMTLKKMELIKKITRDKLKLEEFIKKLQESKIKGEF